MPNYSCTRQSVGAYRCLVSGLVNGRVRHIAASAVNAIGESVMTSPVTTNAYLGPAFDPGQPSYDDQVYVADTTSVGHGVIEVSACAQNGVQPIRFESGAFRQFFDELRPCRGTRAHAHTGSHERHEPPHTRKTSEPICVFQLTRVQLRPRVDSGCLSKVLRERIRLGVVAEDDRDVDRELCGERASFVEKHPDNVALA